MQIKKLNHGAPLLRDLDRSSWFYGTVLSLEERIAMTRSAQ